MAWQGGGQMTKRRITRLLRRILGQATAPFHEHHVYGALLGELEGLEGMELWEDGVGNLLGTYRRGRVRRGAAEWVWCSHMDHPGWVRPPGGGELAFLGGVPKEICERHRSEIVEYDGGAFAMWDLPGFALEGDRVISRACDDLAGCAAIVAALQSLSEGGVEGQVHVAFTRAEEVGFVGASYLAEAWPFGEDAIFLSLETSKPMGAVVAGGGPVLRVGDRTSVFDGRATGALGMVAKREGIEVQRALLDGGSCEATAMAAYGIRSAGISLPLENYHNVTEAGGIGAESVRLSDLRSLVAWLVALVGGEEEDPWGEVRGRIAERRELFWGWL